MPAAQFAAPMRCVQRYPTRIHSHITGRAINLSSLPISALRVAVLYRLASAKHCNHLRQDHFDAEADSAIRDLGGPVPALHWLAAHIAQETVTA